MKAEDIFLAINMQKSKGMIINTNLLILISLLNHSSIKSLMNEMTVY